MNLKKFEEVDTDVPGFVDFWSKKYSDPLEKNYEDNIKQSLTEERIMKLFKWKNGTENISAKKEKSIYKNYIKIPNLPAPKSLDEGRAFLKSLKGGPIWNIFWLHCCNSDLFPIFDQHTYRAMAKITGRGSSEIPGTALEIYRVYLGQYIDFTKQFGKVTPRILDRALFAYGRFLKSTFNNDLIGSSSSGPRMSDGK
jgi:hypothetical protein